RKAYVVAHGDTPFSIAQRFHVTVDDLRQENGLSARASIHSGQKLKLPAGFKAPAGMAESEGAARSRATLTANEGASDEGGGSRAGATGRVETVAGGTAT